MLIRVQGRIIAGEKLLGFANTTWSLSRVYKPLPTRPLPMDAFHCKLYLTLGTKPSFLGDGPQYSADSKINKRIVFPKEAKPFTSH